jgi:hypothetical protein
MDTLHYGIIFTSTAASHTMRCMDRNGTGIVPQPDRVSDNHIDVMRIRLARSPTEPDGKRLGHSVTSAQDADMTAG